MPLISQEPEYYEGDLVEYDGSEWTIEYSPPIKPTRVEEKILKRIGLGTGYLLQRKYDEGPENHPGFTKHTIAWERSIELLEEAEN